MEQINEIKDYFIKEIKERQFMKNWLDKYIVAFNYVDKALTFLSATSGDVFIFSFATVIGAPIGIASVSFSFAFSLTTGLVNN